jgi:hypothetical protein
MRVRVTVPHHQSPVFKNLYVTDAWLGGQHPHFVLQDGENFFDLSSAEIRECEIVPG